uniref:NADH-ubiquinone oxidoreductase chain 3 n=1 Tax=Alloxysta sp. ZJUH_2016001 TaxID=2491149 RepID=A0A3S8V085_9HYME|nr:NADH dehydrogenase subunit 3 [Alloxysta sp. ZJUH_2016001]
MIYLIMINLFLILFMLILLKLNFILSKKNYKIRNKLTPFECGFDAISKLRLPFSINFFMISIIFLIFDVEISLILPVIKKFNLIDHKYLFMMIVVILIIGLYYEWKEGSLKWLN